MSYNLRSRKVSTPIVVVAKAKTKGKLTGPCRLWPAAYSRAYQAYLQACCDHDSAWYLMEDLKGDEFYQDFEGIDECRQAARVTWEETRRTIEEQRAVLACLREERCCAVHGTQMDVKTNGVLRLRPVPPPVL